MGNKLSRRRRVVDERYTRPQGLYQQKDVDHMKLRKLILDSKLAPCYPGDEECACDLEECPICFLYYPSLNRSRCCMKGICTECFLQMKTPNPTRPTQCPFCKTLNYAVEYRGMKTKEEKGLEQMEEQMVIEAKIRMQQQELEDEEDRMQKRHEISSSSRTIEPGMVECSPLTEGSDFVSSQYSSATSAIRQPLHSTNNRDDELDLDLEDIMVTEAIWLSFQENGRQRNPAYGDAAPLEQYITEDCSGLAVMSPLAETSSSPSGGLACAIHSLAEHQQMGGESSSKYNRNMSAFSLLPGCGRFSNIEEQVTEDHPPAGSLNEVSPDSVMAVDGREWGLNHGLEVAEEGTSYASSDAAEDEIEVSSDSRISALPPQDDIEGGFQTVIGTISSKRFEEQMMLAMAISVAEA